MSKIILYAEYNFRLVDQSVAGEGHFEDWSYLRVHGHVFAHSHAVLGVDHQGVLFDGDVMFQCGLGLKKAHKSILCLTELLLKDAH